MKHFNSILTSLLMFVGLVFAGNVSAQTPDWEGTAISAGMASDAKPVYLYNVATKAFFVNGGSWGTEASLNKEYGMPIINVSKSGSNWNIKTQLSTNQGDHICLVTSSYYDDTNKFFCDRTLSARDANVALKFTAVPGSTNNEYYISSVYNSRDRYMTADAITGNSKKGTITSTTSVSEYSKWIIITYDEIRRHLEKNPADLTNPTNVTYLLNDPNLDRGNTKLDSWKTVGWANKGAGLKLGAMNLNKPTPDNRGEATYSGTGNTNEYRQTWGKYFGAEARGVYGKFQQTVKVYHTGWYSVSCQGFYWNNGNANEVVSLFATVDGETTSQFLSLANNEGSVPSNWHAAAQALFPATRYTNAVLFFVQMDNGDPTTGYDANGKEITIGLNWDEDKYEETDWTVFDDFQLEFMGHNNNLILEENVYDYDYLLKTKEQYKNSTLLLNRWFTPNAWNTLVLPVNLTKKQFLTAFGNDARIANLKEVKNGVLRFETIMKSDKTDDFVLLKGNKPYIVYIQNNPTVTREYQASLNLIEGGLEIKTIGGDVTGPYYQIPFVTLNKADLAGVHSYEVGEGDKAMTFTGTFVKTYDDDQNLLVDYDMTGNIIFKGGQVWQLEDDYGMKAYRAWLEPGDYYFPGEEAGAKITFEIDGVEDDATYIHGIFNEGESTAEKFANGIYTINGMNMSATSVENLPKGIYIVNGKKYIVK